jgi:GTPase SAR1 family protein
MSNFLIRKTISVPEQIGFANASMKYNDLNYRLWFLTSKNRHLWRHHYLGTQGVIFIFSTKSKNISENLIIEAMTILKDANLLSLPFLFLFDRSNLQMEEMEESLRNELIEGDYFYNIQHINFSYPKALEEINFGLNWLSTHMKSFE